VLNDQIYWVWLAGVKGISLRDKHKIINETNCAKAIYELSDHQLQKIISKPLAVSKLDRDLSLLDSQLSEWLAVSDKRALILWIDSSYPHLLKEEACPPICLYIEGDSSILNDPQVAMVGSRKNSLYGKKVALELAENLSHAGIVVTSGLALGIDTYSHEGAINAGGATIAVLGNGLGSIYPARNKRLSEKIVELGGCLLSEFPIMAPPLRHHFPRRNRIIAGLSQAVVVVEAEPKSGTLITARLALEQNREVYAVPGSIFSAQSVGCLELIKNGAKPAIRVKDILEDLYIPIKNQALENLKEETPYKTKGLMKYIGSEPISFDEILLESRLTSEKVSSMLIELELKGCI